MKRIHLIATLMALLTATPLLAQKGTLKGNVTGSADGVVESIPFASVAVVELVTGAATDFDGNYSFEVAAGTYTIVVSSIGLLPDTQRVTIVAGQTVTHSVELQKDVKVFDTFEVTAKANQQAEAVQLLNRRKATSIVSNIGVQKLQQTGSSNVADGLKKVAGLSVVGSKFVFVRGMGDRYNSAYLNGLPVPSLNPDKKVIRLDIFPTAITSSLNVSKSFTPELFGDFSGGAIDIRTKQYPDEPTFKVSVGGGFNSQVTFDDFQTYNGGSTDYFGFDDGTRDLPDEVVVEGDRLYNSTNDENYRFEQNFNSRTTTAPINTNWSLLGGNYYEGKKADRGFGFLVTASHRQNFNYREEVYRQVNVQEDFQLDYARESWEKSTNSSVLANLHYDFDKNHHINYNFLLANRSVDNIRESRGTHFDYDDNTILARRTTYREFRVMVHQLDGEHVLTANNRLRAKWGASFANASSKEPDRKQLVYLTGNDGVLRHNVDDLNETHRFWSDLDEDEINGMAEVTYALIYDETEEKDWWNITVGYNLKNKERFFDFSQYNFLIQPEMQTLFPNGVDANNPDLSLGEDLLNVTYEIREQSNPASDYTATLDVHAGYLNTNYYVTPKWQVIGGARFEYADQTIKFRDQATPILQDSNVLDGLDVLPTIASIYELNDKQQLRLSASRTISRPSFREVAPFVYFEGFSTFQQQGNPELTNGENYNLDLRYEIYPNSSELIAFTAFGKLLNDPIEQVDLATSSGRLRSFQNADGATVAGIEMELAKNLGNVFGDSTQWKYLSVGLNAAYIYTEVNLDSGGAVNSTNLDRPLQGASPYLVNADLTYSRYWTDDFKTTFTLSYNVFGKRLFTAGQQGIGDIYEQPVNLLNLVASAEVGDHWSFRLTGRNLLNPSIKQQQESSVEGGDDILVNSFKRGVQISAGISYRF